MNWLNFVFVTGLVPATFAAVTGRATGSSARDVGGRADVAGFLAGFGTLPGGDLMAYATGDKGLDVATVGRLDDALNGSPVQSLTSGLFILGIVVGLTGLGIALWRSRAVPRWCAVVLIGGGTPHPFIPAHMGQGIGLICAGRAFVTVTLAMLRMSNDDFDLPSPGAAG